MPAVPGRDRPGATEPGASPEGIAEAAAAADAARQAAEEAAKAAAAQAAPEAEPAVPEVPAAGPALRGEGPPAEPALDLTGFLTLRDLENTFEKATFRRADLAGVRPNKGYNSIFFEPTKGDGFGVSLQVWRDANLIDSRTRFNTLKATSTNALDTTALPELGFRAYYGGVVTVTFVDARQPLVASLSCSTKLCKKEQIIRLARIVAERMK